MKRRIDEFQWHCGSHPCAHPEAVECKKAWRYSVINGDTAYSLIISVASGELALHRAFKMPSDDVIPGPAAAPRRAFVACDLLPGGQCITVATASHVSMGLPVSPTLSVGHVFWQQHGAMDRIDQPEKFWRALEKAARQAASDARADHHTIACPRCGGGGTITLKRPAAQKRAPRGA